MSSPFSQTRVALLVLVVVACLLTSCRGQTYQVFSCSGRREGLYTNPSDCGGYYQCANGIPTPFARDCAPGALFDDALRACLAAADVHCNGRPNLADNNSNNNNRNNYNYNSGYTTTSPYNNNNNNNRYNGINGYYNSNRYNNNGYSNNYGQTTRPTSVLPSPLQGTVTYTPSNNRVVLRLRSNWNGPTLRGDQCSEIGRLMGRYLRYLVNGYDTTCTDNSACQRGLPNFQVEC